MKSAEGAAARLRTRIWILGGLLTTMYYFVSSVSLPRRTSLGIEGRLFGLEDGSIRLQGSPSGRGWILTSRNDTPRGVMGVCDLLPPVLLDYHWPLDADDSLPPRMTPFRMTGTWLLEDGSVRRVWNFAARGWLGEHRLWFSDETGNPVEPIVLDLRTRHVVSVDENVVRELHAEQSDDDWWDEVGPDSPDPEHVLRTTLSNPLEQLPPDFAGEWDYSTASLGSERVFLVTTRRTNSRPVTVYVVTDEPAPRILRLARNAHAVALSRDGRELFFERNRSLWRLDIRKPLPALLAEVPVPELPDPLGAH